MADAGGEGVGAEEGGAVFKKDAVGGKADLDTKGDGEHATKTLQLIFAPINVSVHTVLMRANINLDTHAYTFASAYANAKGIPLGAAISELLRRAEQAPETASNLLTESRLGLLVRTKQKDDLVITPEMVKEFSEDDPA